MFCTKKTEVIDGIYVVTRGCSIDYRWEDVQSYRDVSGGHIPCIRRGSKETCLCTGDWCNSASRHGLAVMMIIVTSITALIR